MSKESGSSKIPLCGEGPGFELPTEGATKPDPVSQVGALHETISYHSECEPQNRRTRNRRISK